MSPTANSAMKDAKVKELETLPKFHDGIFPFEVPNYSDIETQKAQVALHIIPIAAGSNRRTVGRNLFENAGQMAYHATKFRIREHRSIGHISGKDLQSASSDELLAQYCENEQVPVELRSELTSSIAKLVTTIREGGRVIAETTQPTPWVERTKSKPVAPRPTADVELPDQAPELWLNSPEKTEADAGKAKLDQAVIAFTKRAYSPWFKPDHTGMAVSEIKPLDSELYEELKAARNRMRGRGEPFPFPTIGDRNRALVEKIEAGELLAPMDARLLLTLGQSAARRGKVLGSR